MGVAVVPGILLLWSLPRFPISSICFYPFFYLDWISILYFSPFHFDLLLLCHYWVSSLILLIGRIHRPLLFLWVGRVLLTRFYFSFECLGFFLFYLLGSSPPPLISWYIFRYFCNKIVQERKKRNLYIFLNFLQHGGFNWTPVNI